MPSNTAILLIHGFTATPDCLAPLASHLRTLGFTVLAPLLAGHGGTRDQLAKTGWHEWYAGCEKEFHRLKQTHNKVFICGLSLGGLLGLRLAQNYPKSVSALCCLATPLFLKRGLESLILCLHHSPARWLYPYQKKNGADIKDKSAEQHYIHQAYMPISSLHSLVQLQKTVRKDLARVTQPLLLVHSLHDSTAPYKNMPFIFHHVASDDKEMVTLKNSFHVITIDYDKGFVQEKVGEFFLKRS